MRAAAEVHEFAGGIKGNHQLVGFFFHQFTFEDLIALFVEIERFRLGNKLALVRQILRGKFVHLLFDFRQVFGSERFLAQKFVEKAGVNRRTDAQLYVGIELHHCRGKKVRRGMPKDEQRIGILFGEDPYLHVMIDGAAQVDQLALIRSVGERRAVGCRYVRDQRGIRKPRRNLSRDIGRCSAFRHFLDTAVGQCNVDLLHVRIHPERETSSLSAASRRVKEMPAR